MKIVKGGETINENNEKVASVTLEDGSVSVSYTHLRAHET